MPINFDWKKKSDELIKNVIFKLIQYKYKIKLITLKLNIILNKEQC